MNDDTHIFHRRIFRNGYLCGVIRSHQTLFRIGYNNTTEDSIEDAYVHWK